MSRQRIVVILVLLIALIGFTAYQFSRDDDVEPIPASEPTTVAELSGTPFVSPSRVVQPLSHKAIRQALVGPTFVAGDETREFRLRDVPVTFLAPNTWGCLRGTAGTLPAWRCIDEHMQGSPTLDIVVNSCGIRCEEAHHGPPVTSLIHQAKLTRRDATTRYAEETVNGRYVLTVDLVFANAGEQWVIAAQAIGAPAQAPVVQRILNDIYSQTRADP